MSDLGYTIIGFAIGYFWAMWRVDNIRIHGFKVVSHINAGEFWDKLEAWKTSQENIPE